ncbi:AAA family ATPase, partial [Bradyrhizobium diazoefficiens]|uniref:AAA family ATPase n=3 Tax=Nitrobacteraceae TaxID=41294 RepID=UPI001B8CED3B
MLTSIATNNGRRHLRPRTAREHRKTPLPAPVGPWWRDAAGIPPRQTLFGGHYIRRSMGATIGGGGRAKTTLAIFEAVSMAAGKDLSTGEALASGRLRVWVLNGEEDQDELDRRIAAVCQHYGVTAHDLAGGLFVQSVRDNRKRRSRPIRKGLAWGLQSVDQRVCKSLAGGMEAATTENYEVRP